MEKSITDAYLQGLYYGEGKTEVDDYNKHGRTGNEVFLPSPISRIFLHGDFRFDHVKGSDLLPDFG